MDQNMDHTENQEMEQEKTFTQEDVNRIVQERLSRAKLDAAPDLEAREAALFRREIELDAREKLADAGLPQSLLSALNCSDKETMEKSIAAVQALIPQKSGYRIVDTSVRGGSGRSEDEDIRKAMGLKG